ncbi:MAG: PAS domain S-box protein [Novosphingobium sp.]|nr:PAS domain S-box protein [Novosphingobium sp.]
MHENDLSRHHGWADLLVQSVTDYAIYMLDPTGVVISWNPGAERFKGYRAEEIIGQHFSRFYEEADRLALVPQRALRTAETEGRFEAEGWRLRKDGSRFWASVVIDPVRGPDGTMIGFAKITRDLTERREAQIALEQAREALFQSQKMEAIGQLTGGVAHDFNNLLCAIIGSIDLAERRGAAGGDIAGYLHNARQAAERGATLTQRMLAFARKQDLDLRAVDLAAMIPGSVELLRSTIGASVDIDMRIAPALPPVRADAAQLELALLNLAVNARDAMGDGGRIAISAHVAAGCGDLAARDYVVLTVRDEGEGMDGDTLRRAAEPFFTTKGVGKGTGLGLSMVQGMAEQCGGRLVLRSAPGTGTTAELWLPVAVDPAPAETAPQAGPQGCARALDILAVDDDCIVLMNTVAMLEDMGHRVREATSGPAALDLLRHHDFDLIVTDYAMPGMTGAELIAAARAIRPELRVALVSGYVDLPEGGLGDVPRLGKPFDDRDLAALLAASGV